MNEKLVKKVNGLSWINNDMKILRYYQNRYGFLDKNLHLKRFKPHISNLYHLIPSEVAHKLCDLVNNINYIDLEDHTS
jgi:two-component system CheB/CheR fusion protein